MRGFDVMSICLGWLVCAGLAAGVVLVLWVGGCMWWWVAGGGWCDWFCGFWVVGFVGFGRWVLVRL